MGKAKRDGSTPKQPTAIELALTPKQRASFQRMMAEKLEQAARLDKAAKAIDRALAIRDGLIPPPWAERPTTIAKDRKEGPKEARINLIACELWKPDGKPPADLGDGDIVQQVGDAYQKKYGHTVHRTTILRSEKIGRLERPQ